MRKPPPKSSEPGNHARRLTQEQVERLHVLHRAGVSQHKIALELGCTQAAVAFRLASPSRRYRHKMRKILGTPEWIRAARHIARRAEDATSLELEQTIRAINLELARRKSA